MPRTAALRAMLRDGARFWLSALVLVSCVASAYAKASVADGTDSARSRALHWGAVAAGGALLAQLMLGAGEAEKTDEQGEVNTSLELTWREDEGASKLVPIYPGKLAQAVNGPLSTLAGSEPDITATVPSFLMSEVAAHDSRDDVWIVVDGLVYDVTKYVDRHPGGWLPLVNMAGKDCTDVFANYHGAKVYRTMLPAFLVGKVTDLTIPEHVKDFRAVRQELLRRGLFQTDMRFYAKLGAWYLFLLLSSLFLSLACSSLSAHMAGAAVLGLFWQQMAGLGHDLGHSGVTHVFHRDMFFGATVMNALMGISTGWWKRSHNTHHVVCNSIENDPDIQHLPIFAVAAKCFDWPFLSSYHDKTFGFGAVERFLVAHQHLLFYPVMMFARFNLYIQSWVLLLSPAGKEAHYRKSEAVALAVYACWVSAVALSMPTWIQTAGWLLVSHSVTALLHVQITISHWAMETYHGRGYNDATDEWYITQLKTTMNVDTPEWLDWLHIGLQFQIEHHLYPRLPRHNLRKARVLVRAVCAKHGIPYHEPGFFQANLETLSALRTAALAARKSARDPKHGFYASGLWDAINAIG